LAKLTRKLNRFTELKTQVTDLTKLSVGMEKILNTLIAYSDNLNKPIDFIKHVHKCHGHFFRHDVEQMNDECEDEKLSQYFIKKATPKLEHLALELYCDQDLTSNKKIYGTDYYFKSDNTPDAFKFINYDFRFDKKDKLTTTWNNYISFVLQSILECPLDFDIEGEYEDVELKIIRKSIINIKNIRNIIRNLILETKYGCDLDDNGLIYGKHFTIPDINQQVKYLDIISSFYEDPNDPNKIPKYDINRYFRSVHLLPDISIMINVPNILEPELIKILINEIQTGTDGDDDGYIYGKDIIILDPPYPLSEHIPLCLPNTIISWNAYKQCYDLFLQSVELTRDYKYYVGLLLSEFSENKDLDYNTLKYNVDFIIKDDEYKPEELDYFDQNESLNQISFKDYIDGLPFVIRKSKEDPEVLCVRLAHEFTNELVDIDNNGHINGLDFIISDCDPNKFNSLITLEKSTMFSICRDNLKYIKCRYFYHSNIVADYTFEQFSNYWKFINSIDTDPLIDTEHQDEFGRTISGGQIECICYPIWVNKTGMFPLFIPILSLYDLDKYLDNQVHFNLTISIKFPGSGYVESTPKLINCSTDCSETLLYNSRITLTPYPSYGYEFKYWSGFDSCDIIENSTEPICKLIMFNDKNINAYFQLKKYKLTIIKENGEGIIKDDNNNILFDNSSPALSTKEFIIEHGTNLLLGVLVDIDKFVFDKWIGVDKETKYDEFTSVGIIKMLSDRTVTVVFAKMYNLTININTDVNAIVEVFIKNIKQQISTSYIIKEDIELTLYAIPSVGYIFDEWDGVDVSYGTKATVIMNSDRTVNVNFIIKNFYLQVSKYGGTGVITDNSGFLNCGDICRSIYDYGTTTVLTVQPDSHYNFIGWVGSDNDSTSTTCFIVVKSNRMVSANFAIEEKTLTIKKIGIGNGVIRNSTLGISCQDECQFAYDYGSIITLEAVPNSGATFIDWIGADTENGNQCTINMNADKTVSGQFDINKYILTLSFDGGLGIIKDDSLNIRCPKYTVNSQQFDFFESNKSPDEWYEYINSRSENDFFQFNKTCIIIPYLNTIDNSLSLILRTGSKTNTLAVNSLSGNITNLPSEYYLLLSDDAGESYSDTDTSVKFTFTYNPSMTDGLIISGLDNLESIQIKITEYQNVDNFKIIHKTGSFDYNITLPITISKNMTCSYELNYDQQVNLILNPIFSQYDFKNWGGTIIGDSVSGESISFNIKSNRNITAIFETILFNLTVLKTGNGVVKDSRNVINCGTSCSSNISYGTIVTLTATAESNYEFYNWIGCPEVTGNICKITIVDDTTTTANFAHLVNGLIFRTTAETNEFLISYAIPNMESIFNNWDVFTNDISDPDNPIEMFYVSPSRPTIPPGSTWTYNSGLDSIYQSSNSECPTGFVSKEKLNNFTLEATLKSDNYDDDSNGIIIAFVRDEVNKQNHYLTAYVTNGGTATTQDHVTYNKKFSLVYDISTAYSDATGNWVTLHNRMWVIGTRDYDGVNPTASFIPGEGWQKSGPCRVKVVRNGDNITCYCTNWNDLENYNSNPIVIDLNSDSRLSIFKGNQSYGVMTYSQASSYYKDIVLTGGLAYDYIYDNEAKKAYSFISPSWVQIAKTPQEHFGVISKVYNPLKNYNFIVDLNTITFV